MTRDRPVAFRAGQDAKGIVARRAHAQHHRVKAQRAAARLERLGLRLLEMVALRHPPGRVIPCNVRREGGLSLVILEGKEGNPL